MSSARVLAFVSILASPHPAAAQASSAGAALPPRVAGYPIGWCLRVQGTTLEDAKAAGFEYVELALQDVLSLDDDAFERLVARLRGLGIPALTGYNLVPNELKVVGPDVDRGQQDTHLRKALERVGRLGVKFVIFGSGKARQVPDGFSREQALEQLVDFSRRMADEAGRHGLAVLVQPLRRQDTNLVNGVDEALQLVSRAARPNLHIMVDYSFMAIEKEDPAVLLKAGSHLKHVQISNPNGRVYPMQADEADYASFFRSLAAIGYRGGISVHARTDDFNADAPRAIAFLRTMASELAMRPAPGSGP